MKFKIKQYEFLYELKTVPFIATLVALIILLSLSGWQIKRLYWKEALISERIFRFENESVKLEDIKDPKSSEFRKVLVKGKFLNDNEMFMPALSKRGNNGYHILVPLKIADKLFIFDRGWIPLKRKDREKRLLNEISELHEIEAVIRLPGKKGRYQPDNEPENNFWFFVEPNLMSEYTGMNLQADFYLEAKNNGPNNSPLGNQTRIYIRNNHLQYAITWFLISCGLIGVYLASSIKRLK